ncbi:hypothetical protein, partial [Paenibacillus sp. IHBB 3054]|uniref:hypothetical protein n=1 Tax=Paenibacillus sp. IHBB 3054 TaxID=3425689 RepID=UPI003F6818D8
ERKKLEESLRAKDKQIDFYFRKVNELINELNQSKLNGNPIKGEKDLRLEDQLVWDVLESEEYKTLLEEYSEYYGIIDESDIPKTETLGGFRYKIEESITEGYDLLPVYYGWTNTLMHMRTKEFRELDTLYKEHFGEGIPTEQIFGTMEELIDIVNKSVKEGRNLLPEYYGL